MKIEELRAANNLAKKRWPQNRPTAALTEMSMLEWAERRKAEGISYVSGYFFQTQFDERRNAFVIQMEFSWHEDPCDEFYNLGENLAEIEEELNRLAFAERVLSNLDKDKIAAIVAWSKSKLANADKSVDAAKLARLASLKAELKTIETDLQRAAA